MQYRVRPWMNICLAFWLFDIISSIVIFYMGGSDWNPLYFSDDPFWRSTALIFVHMMALWGLLLISSFFKFPQHKGIPFMIGAFVYLIVDLNNILVFIGMLTGLPVSFILGGLLDGL